MRLGIFLAVLACFIWAFNFIVPQFVPTFSPIEIALGRYFVYGVLSIGVFIFHKNMKLSKYSPRCWGQAFIFALLSNVLYYISLVFALRYATAPVTVLLLGMTPVVVALYGNWKGKECSYRSLVLPCLAVVLGIVLVNISEIDWSFKKYSLIQYSFGLSCALFSLFSWSWYAVHNARFLKRNVHIDKLEWATLLGITSLIWTLFFVLCFEAFRSSQIDLLKIVQPNMATFVYWCLVLFLGFFCSWIGVILWNLASAYLPVSLMGTLIITETLFGLTLVYLADHKLPTLLEAVGASIILIGIYLCIRVFKKSARSFDTPAAPQDNSN